MNEYSLQLIALSKIAWISVFSFLYGLGGISNKWLRRFVACFWIGLGIYVFSIWQNNWHWLKIITPILLCITLHLGYGAEKTIQKIKKRAIVGVCLGMCDLPLAFLSGLWMLFFINLALCITVSILFGVFNPFKNARDEETNIATFSKVLTMFMI
jgi:hypothetical protein